MPMPTGANVLGLVWLSVIGAAVAYILWFRGIARIDPAMVSLLGFLTPGTAVLLGWLILDQTLTALQMFGFLLAVASIWLGQRASRRPESSSERGNSVTMPTRH